VSLKTVAERLDAWLALHDDGLPPKGQRLRVASEIGVTPEALYRELARRREQPVSALRAYSNDRPLSMIVTDGRRAHDGRETGARSGRR
jgi:hypothetical protein